VLVAYLRGLAMRRIADLHADEAKTDAGGAYIIAEAARSLPHTLRSLKPADSQVAELMMPCGFDEDLAGQITQTALTMISTATTGGSHLWVEPPQADVSSHDGTQGNCISITHFGRVLSSRAADRRSRFNKNFESIAGSSLCLSSPCTPWE
jgi:hypothetical protein